MISFLQLNYQSLIGLAILTVCYFLSKYITKKNDIMEANPFINWIFGIVALMCVAFILASTLHNQVPKTTIDRSFVEQSTNNYQESVINATQRK
jgi:hydrogenase-4 membrane subunit HyfE